jgi:hypothetical protein
MSDSTVFEMTLSPTTLRGELSCHFDYMDIKIRDIDSEYPEDIRRACYGNDGSLHARLTILVGAENATEILERLHRGETIRLPGRFTRQQLLDMNAYPRYLRTA